MDPLTLLLAWIIFSYFVADVLPAIVEAVVFVTLSLPCWIWRVFWRTVSLIYRAMALTTRYCFVAALWAAPYIRDGLLLLYFFLREALRPSAAEDGKTTDDRGKNGQGSGPGEDTPPEQDPYEIACALLGLRGTFSRQEFVTAYRRAIRRAHPDHGGSTARAQAINEARARIARRRSWHKGLS